MWPTASRTGVEEGNKMQKKQSYPSMMGNDGDERMNTILLSINTYEDSTNEEEHRVRPIKRRARKPSNLL
jgi:hypothetical protein